MSEAQGGIPQRVLLGSLTYFPPVVIRQVLHVLIAKMRVLRPRLFRNLSRLPCATVLIEPLDVRHSFLLRLGVPIPSIELCDSSALSFAPCATIKAPLSLLIDMLEGRVDGDKLFFSRDIVMTGKTDIVVALRNTLDREELSVFDDALSLVGPFSRPLSRLLRTVEGALDRHKNKANENLF